MTKSSVVRKTVTKKVATKKQSTTASKVQQKKQIVIPKDKVTENVKKVDTPKNLIKPEIEKPVENVAEAKLLEIPASKVEKTSTTEIARKLVKVAKARPVVSKFTSHKIEKLGKENLFLSDQNFVPKPFKARPLDPKIYSTSAVGQHGIPNYKTKKPTKSISPKLGKRRAELKALKSQEFRNISNTVRA